MMLMQGINLWVKQMIADGESLEKDVLSLDDITYRSSGIDQQGKGARSWS